MPERAFLLIVALVASQAQLWASNVLDAKRTTQVLRHPSVPTWPVAWFYGGMRNRAAADLQWVRAASYAGNAHFEAQGRPALAPLLQRVVSLNGGEQDFYRLGGLLLASESASTRDAVALFGECARRFSHNASCPFYAGVLRLTRLQDAQGAAREWRLARARPGAPAYLDSLLERLEVKDGRCVVAVFALRQLMDATPAHARAPLLEQERRLRLECTVQQLEAAVEVYRQRHQKPPAGVEALLEEGVLKTVPQDPFGQGFDITPDGRVVARAGVPRVNLGSVPGSAP